jgi:hypothetical protein
VRASVFLKLRDVFMGFSSRLREHILSAEEAIIPLWREVAPVDRLRVGAAISDNTSAIAQWWLPWYSNEFSDEQYLEVLNATPACCSGATQLSLHRYLRPQWRSRVDPLLPSIYDASVISPTAKEAPHLLWCCFGYDAEDPQSQGFCLSVPRFRSVRTAPRVSPWRAPRGGKPAPPPRAAPAPTPAAAPPRPAAAAAAPAPVAAPANSGPSPVGAPANLAAPASGAGAMPAQPAAVAAPTAASVPAPAAAAAPAVAAAAPAGESKAASSEAPVKNELAAKERTL